MNREQELTPTKQGREPLILVINPGSTSTKTAVFAGEQALAGKNLSHSAEELAPYCLVYEQLELRKAAILSFLQEEHLEVRQLDCVVGRGGLLQPVEGGTYLVDEDMCRYLRDTDRQHASNLGAILAKAVADGAGIPAYIVDPVVVDELDPLARFSGLAGVERKSIFHALNQKATARKAAARLGKTYQECSFIVAHLGGGISVGAHYHGRVVDVNNALDGDGPFSPERAGGIPVCSLLEMAFQGGFQESELRKALVGRGGLVSYLGTNDARTVEKLMDEGDKGASLVYEAMAYQVAKEIGGCAAVLKGAIDAIVLTGGIAYSTRLVQWITERVSFLAPVLVFPGEGEMEALAAGALRVHRGQEECKIYAPPQAG